MFRKVRKHWTVDACSIISYLNVEEIGGMFYTNKCFMKTNQAEFKTRKLIRKQNKSISIGKIMITCLIPAYI